MELINSVTGVDEDGRSRQRVLTFAAKRYHHLIPLVVLLIFASYYKAESLILVITSMQICRYASAIERNPDDYDALYNWALVLQVCIHSLLDLVTQSKKCQFDLLIRLLYYR